GGWGVGRGLGTGRGPRSPGRTVRARPSAPPPRRCPRSSAPFALGQYPPGPLDDREIDHRAVERDDPLALPLERLDHRPCPFDLALARPEQTVNRPQLGRMDAGLAPEAERPAETTLVLEAALVARVEMDDVERTP